MSNNEKEPIGWKKIALVFMIIASIVITAKILWDVSERTIDHKYTKNRDLSLFINKNFTENVLTESKTLPSNINSLTYNGSCYVTVKKNGLFIIFFPLNNDSLDLYGYMYTSRTLEPRDYEPPGNFEGVKPQIIGIRGKIILPLTITTQCDSHWYRVVEKVD